MSSTRIIWEKMRTLCPSCLSRGKSLSIRTILPEDPTSAANNCSWSPRAPCSFTICSSAPAHQHHTSPWQQPAHSQSALRPQLVIMYHQPKFATKRNRLKFGRYNKKEYILILRALTVTLTLRTATHFCSHGRWCITTSSLLTEGLVVQKTTSGQISKFWTFLVTLTTVIQYFTDTLTYDTLSLNAVGLQKESLVQKTR